MYIYELTKWPELSWDQAALTGLLADARHRQGKLLGQMTALGFSVQNEANLQALTEDAVRTSEIEGQKVDAGQARSSIARRLGMDEKGLSSVHREVEGIAEVLTDAAGHYEAPLSESRLAGWHAALFPAGRSGMRKITPGAWRTDASGPMQVVSGPMGRENIHYEAPAANRLPDEMARFIEWFNADQRMDKVLAAALAHFWFVTIHPFEDGNGRIARAIADMMLARSEKSPRRFYSMSSQIQRERNAYYEILERSQKSSLDITPWMVWFLGCFNRAVEASEEILESVLFKARFWEAHAGESFNERQKTVILMLLGDFKGGLTSSKWAKLAKCSQDTALRDITDLVSREILQKDEAGGRSTNYHLLLPGGIRRLTAKEK